MLTRYRSSVSPLAEHQTSLLALQAKIGQHTLWEPPMPSLVRYPRSVFFLAILFYCWFLRDNIGRC